MKMTSQPLALIIFVVLFGGIAVTTSIGWWQTKGGGRVPARLQEGAQAGRYNPADIRGSSTFGEVSDFYEVPLEDLRLAFLIPSDVDASVYKVKSLETLYADLPLEVGTSSVRMFVAYYTGLPYQPTEETYLFPPAVEILLRTAALTGDQEAYLKAHTVESPITTAPASVAPPAKPEASSATTEPAGAAGEQHSKPERMVNGQTTFQDLLDWGLPVQTIETLLGKPLPQHTLRVRDYCSQNSLPFSDLKTRLQAELDAFK